MTRPSGTARRLASGFGALVILLGAASWVALAGSARVQRGLDATREREEGVRLAFQLASAVRDQYAHQAHTIILGDDSHLRFYGEAARRVADLTARLRAVVTDPEEREWVDAIAAESGRLDHAFRDEVVPAVLAHDRDAVQAAHVRLLGSVGRIEDLSGRLLDRFEKSMRALAEEAEAVRTRTRRIMLALLVAAPLVALGVSVAIVRSVAAPLARLGAGADRIAAGDLDGRVAEEGPAEFVALARQLNAMTAALKEHQEKLVRSEKLAGIGRLAAGVAHEINNPLGVILGYAKILARRAEGPLAEDLAVIEEETLRAKEIVEGLLDLSRPMAAEARPVDLRALCDEVVSRLREARLLEGVDVAVDGAATASGSQPQLRQVVHNLVRNAAEAAGPGGRVEIAIAARGGEAEVQVSDSGEGIAPEARERLFEPFLTTKPRGTGLGLAVSRAIARAHGGDLVAGDAPGGGARFALRIPAAAEAEVAA
jgi:two-component system NtrC family sensor kinase